MKLSATKLTIIILGSILTASMGLYGFLYWSINDQQVAVANLAQDIVNETEKAKHLNENKVLFEQIVTKREALDSYFLGTKDEDTVAFLVALEGLASTSKVRLDINTPTLIPLSGKTAPVTSKDPVVLKGGGMPANTDKWEMLRLQLKVDGGWSDVLQFIELVEAMPYQTTLTQANLVTTINPDPKKKGNLWDGVLTLTVLKKK